MNAKSLRSAVALAALCSVAGGYAADAPAPGGGPVMEACQKDVQTLCPGVQPGGGRIVACLKKNQAKVSDACKEAVKAQRGERKHAPT